MRDEFRDVFVGEPLPDLAGEVDPPALTAAGVRHARRDERDHHFRRHLRNHAGNLAEHAIELFGTGPGDEIGQRLKDQQDQILLDALAALFRLRDQPLGEIPEARRVAGDVEQRRHRLVVEIENSPSR